MPAGAKHSDRETVRELRRRRRVSRTSDGFGVSYVLPAPIELPARDSSSASSAREPIPSFV